MRGFSGGYTPILRKRCIYGPPPYFPYIICCHLRVQNDWPFRLCRNCTQTTHQVVGDKLTPITPILTETPNIQWFLVRLGKGLKKFLAPLLVNCHNQIWLLSLLASFDMIWLADVMDIMITISDNEKRCQKWKKPNLIRAVHQ